MAETRKPRNPTKRNHHRNQKHTQKKAEKTPSWDTLRVMFSCKHHYQEKEDKRKCARTGCSVSLCKIIETSKGTIKGGISPSEDSKKWESSVNGCRSVKGPLCRPVSSSFSSHSSSHSLNATSSSSSNTAASNSLGGSFRGLHLRRFSGCYECHTVVNPIHGVTRNPSFRSTIFCCSDCGEIFMKSETLELHQAVKHAVSELGPEDTGRKIVEIIFQSSWIKRQTKVCTIDRILKINNTQKTLEKFDEYRDSIKSKATKLSKKYPRCIADGNELLRFHSTSFTCSIGSDGSTKLCKCTPNCNLCSILKDGFKVDVSGRIKTMATSGRAHDTADVDPENEKRAMLVCRVIAGRIKKSHDVAEEYDSVCGPTGLHSKVDKLFVFNPKAILPCFLVIYRIFST